MPYYKVVDGYPVAASPWEEDAIQEKVQWYPYEMESNTEKEVLCDAPEDVENLTTKERKKWYDVL